MYKNLSPDIREKKQQPSDAPSITKYFENFGEYNKNLTLQTI